MQFRFATFVALIAATFVNAQGAADPSINTPSGVVECLPVQLTFSGTQPPFIVEIHPGGQPDTPAIKTFDPTSANSITWVVDQRAGTSLTLVIRDAIGRTNPSAPFNVLPGNPSCLTGGGASSAPASVPASSAPGTTPASTPATTPAASTSAAAQPSTVPSSSRATSSVASVSRTSVASSAASSAAAAATSSNAASHAVQPLGLAGLLGLVGLAALV